MLRCVVCREELAISSKTRRYVYYECPTCGRRLSVTTRVTSPTKEVSDETPTRSQDNQTGC